MKQNKTLYRALLIAAFIAVNLLILFGISNVLTYLNSGANKSDLFHEDVAKEVVSNATVTWEDLINPGRPLEIPTKEMIERDYLESWYIRNKALSTGDIAGIDDTFTQLASKNLYDLLAYNTEQNITVESINLSHQLHLNFYSADGQLVVITDRGVTTYTRVFKNGIFTMETEEVASYKIVMLLEDGHWRIRHMEKLTAEIPELTKRPAHQFEAKMAGMNYYPQHTPWDTFGDKFSEKILETDFKIIKDLGLNTIRIFVGYEDFGMAAVDESKLEKLNSLLDEAQAQDLQVIVTLFDFYGDYSIESWPKTRRHAHAIVNKVKNHEALLGWDVKNEPDLDFDNRTAHLVKAWLLHMTQYIQKIDERHPVTIGWSSAEAALDLSDYVDYVSFHHYKDLEELPTIFQQLQLKTDKELVLQEFGLSSDRGFWNPFGSTEADQLEFYSEFFRNQKRDSLHYLSWTLYDFSTVPNNVVGKRPWRRNKQSNFGIIDNAGEHKAAYQAFLLD